MEISKEAQEFFDWRETERLKHRTMTFAEYRAWCFAGDSISSPFNGTPFPGGLTILCSNGVLGKTG